MKEVLLVLTVIGAVILGFFVMKRLDVFLEKNKKTTKDKQANTHSDFIYLDHTSQEKMFEQLNEFKKEYPNVKVIAYDDSSERINKIVERYKQ